MSHQVKLFAAVAAEKPHHPSLQPCRSVRIEWVLTPTAGEGAPRRPGPPPAPSSIGGLSTEAAAAQRLARSQAAGPPPSGKQTLARRGRRTHNETGTDATGRSRNEYSRGG